MSKKIKSLTKPQFEKFYKTLNQCDGIGELKVEDYLTIKKIIKITKPESILEFGFKNGSSASMWGAASPLSKIVSTDVWVKDIQNENAFKINSIMKGGSFRLDWIDIHTLPEKKESYVSDLIFVDGDPYKVEFEIEIAKQLNPKYIVLNNWFHSRHREEVQLASQRFGFKLIEAFTTECGIAVLSNNDYIEND